MSLTAGQLLEAASKAAHDLEAATTKAEVAEVFRRHYRDVGYKALGRMLIGTSPEQAVAKWAARLESA